MGGEIDLATAPRLREEIVRLVDAGRDRLLVDLEGVEFMDSTGLGVLVAGLKHTRERGGDLALVCRRPQVLRLLAITGLDGVLAVHADASEASAPPPVSPG